MYDHTHMMENLSYTFDSVFQPLLSDKIVMIISLLRHRKNISIHNVCPFFLFCYLNFFLHNYIYIDDIISKCDASKIISLKFFLYGPQVQVCSLWLVIKVGVGGQCGRQYSPELVWLRESFRKI